MPEEDIDVDLTYLYKEKDHHALSKDVDVAIWQDYRAYKCLDPVLDATDIIVINNQQHDEFDEFKKTEIMSYISYLKMNEILQLYLQHRPHLVKSVITRYKQTYIQLSSTQVDELCKWVYKLRNQFVAKGAEVFKAEVEEVKQNVEPQATALASLEDKVNNDKQISPL